MTAAPTPAEAPFAALDACHQAIAAHLDALRTLGRHLEDHGADDRARGEARRIEAFFSGTSREHHAEEERSVFPPLLAGGSGELVDAVRKLQQDHGWIEENWIELAPRLRALADGQGWTDPTELQDYIAVFAELLLGHIALEETLVYPESRARWAALVERRRGTPPPAPRRSAAQTS